jgi:8-oxo-dGTP pyrophosphatase MutT (NUDIX family)
MEEARGVSDAPVPALSVPVRPAATVMLLRDGVDGVEVFMLQRTHSAVFARGQYVFPGGKVDDVDHADELDPYCDGDDATASAAMSLERGGLAWQVAAIRECFEEAGVLLARRVDGDDPVRFDDPDTAGRFTVARHAVHGGERSMVEVCRDERLVLLADRVHLVDHWLTPIGERRRFDTRFFVAHAPEAQEPLHDDTETIASLWVRPADALEMMERGELGMLPPTIFNLRRLASYATADDAVAAAARAGVPPCVFPRLLLDDGGRIRGVVRPDQEGYDATPVPEFVVANPR